MSFSLESSIILSETIQLLKHQKIHLSLHLMLFSLYDGTLTLSSSPLTIAVPRLSKPPCLVMSPVNEYLRLSFYKKKSIGCGQWVVMFWYEDVPLLGIINISVFTAAAVAVRIAAASPSFPAGSYWLNAGPAGTSMQLLTLRSIPDHI